MRATTNGGYGRIRHGNDTLAHRLAWKIYHGEIATGLCVLHKCDTPSCVNPAHLFLGTYSDNIADMDRKGRAHRHVIGARTGEMNGRAKLTTDEVISIRDGAVKGQYSRFARELGVAPTLVRRIALGQAWKHLGEAL